MNHAVTSAEGAAEALLPILPADADGHDQRSCCPAVQAETASRAIR